MRWALCVLLLAGCGVDPVTLTALTIGTAAGSVAVVRRTPFDVVWSLATGKDCSAVRLEQGKTYCRAAEPPPEPVPYCTRSLGVADCWAVEPPLSYCTGSVGVAHCWADPAGHPPGLADGPSSLTPAQEADRTRGWPF